MPIHDPAKIGRFAREHFSSALMSDTKWRKVLNAIKTANPSVQQMVVKFIDVEEPRTMNFPPSLACPHAYMDTIEFGPVELRAIEWLDIPANIGPTLEPLGQFPIEEVTTGTRIVGYRA